MIRTLKSFLEKMGLLRLEVELYQCSIVDCPHATTKPFHENPRFRWIVGLLLKNEQGEDIRVNLCPAHVRTLLPVDDDFFETTARTESFIREGKFALEKENREALANEH